MYESKHPCRQRILMLSHHDANYIAMRKLLKIVYGFDRAEIRASTEITKTSEAAAFRRPLQVSSPDSS